MKNITNVILKTPTGQIRFNRLKEARPFKNQEFDANGNPAPRSYSCSVAFSGAERALLEKNLELVNDAIFKAKLDPKLQKNLNLFKIDPENPENILVNFSRSERAGMPGIEYQNGDAYPFEYIQSGSDVEVHYKAIPYSQEGRIKFKMQIEKVVVLKLAERASDICPQIDISGLPIVENCNTIGTKDNPFFND